MRVIIAGSRAFGDLKLVDLAVTTARFVITEVVSGDASSGIDQLAIEWAKIHGIPFVRFPANWNDWGPMAGRMRNGQMARYGQALIAIWDGSSPGTANMVKQAVENLLPVYVAQAKLVDGDWQLTKLEVCRGVRTC